MKRTRHDENRQILGRVSRAKFVGRGAELERLVSTATQPTGSRGLLILLAPLAGVSELLRQTYDALFNKRGDVVPIYFALPRADTTPVSAAIEFLNTFLLQYLAFRRDEPSLCQASKTLNDLIAIAPAADLDWIEELVEDFNSQRFADDDRALVRFCLNAPRRAPESHGRPFVMLEALHLGSYADAEVPFATELLRSFEFSRSPFALAGLRREMLSSVDWAGSADNYFEKLHLERLNEDNAGRLLASAARNAGVSLSDETRDLLVQQLEGSPYLLTAMVQAAREKHLALDSYLTAERLYVDELLGGRLNLYFSSVLERVAPLPETRRSLVRLLSEAVPSGSRAASVESWQKKLKVNSADVEAILRRLHVEELINWDGENIDTGTESNAWRDYLGSRFRLDALREPRALVVADIMATALKRAPQTIARHYRRAANLQLRELLAGFSSQLVPRRLFLYDEFAKLYKGAELEEIGAGLDSDTDILRLPEVFHTASGSSFSRQLSQFGDDSCVVAHAFDGASYIDANEVVWLVARVESKLEADQSVVESWCERLDDLARKSGFVGTQIWLISNEGFSAEACEWLREQSVYFSSRQQVEILASRASGAGGSVSSGESDEVELILPMGSDYELLAANTVEQIARRLDFRPEAINQIKTAIVEACINASEHSLSPDRKIYQRFRVGNDKLVITIASRGIVPSDLNGHNREALSGDFDNPTDQRRGWGLKLIKTLMDEVEFERVDEGTSLRMTKYVRGGISK